MMLYRASREYPINKVVICKNIILFSFLNFKIKIIIFTMFFLLLLLLFLETSSTTSTISPASLQPYFDFDVQRNVTVTVGQTGFLHCRVERLGDKDVSLYKKILY